ncbi:ATP-binding protein [Xanthobacter autotrophicus DSM 597]|uniref:ATP-binding protein n=1 Tax=Xanthobacter TaxID=279 RepID=UPI001DF84CB2|nr:signal transduction histidine kinase [Xanthobacter flavus]
MSARNRLLRFIWPGSLAGRLVLLLVATLALAQGLLVLVLQSEHDAVVAGIVRGQALSQTVTLTRLIESMPEEQADRLAGAFTTRGTCAWVSDDPPDPHEMTLTEEGLARLLGRRLHGVGKGPPAVRIRTDGLWDRRCPERSSEDFPWLRRGTGGPVQPLRPGLGVVALSVPLSGQRWLHMDAVVGLPGIWSRPIVLSFLISALAVSLVTVACVRLQTRSLRSLADASERFGRGETVPPLDVHGPTEVAAATRAFNTMQQRLSQFMRDRMRLLASISHDLRTPLTTLRLKAEFVDDAEVRNDIIATIDELVAICEATLAFTRAEATSEETRTVDIAELCAEVVDEFAGVGADAEMAEHAAGVLSAPILLPCRPVALRRALRNLVDNAVRYGGKAVVSVQAPVAGTVAIRVEDDGPGLPEDRFEEAFQPFVRLEPSRSTETGGIGLGLAIARSIVKAHGGELTLANRPGGGLCAKIVLPTVGSGSGAA